MKTRLPKIYIDTLGCSKNTVDSEAFAAQARANDFIIVDHVEQADTLLINTCGFIDAAKQESIDHILSGVDLKEQGKLDRLMVMGCLSDRYASELKADIPEVDAYFGSSHTSIPEVLNALGGDFKKELLGERSLSTPRHFAYLKISEGCDNPCSFCAIPLMRGGHKSTPMEQLIKEAEMLRAKGVRELIVIGQDTTYYGLDLYGKRCLDELLLRLSDVGFDWIRLLYAYPAKFPSHILPVIRERENICSYIDMPLQHGSTEVLKSMRRGVTRNRLEDLISEIRSEVPGIRLRTTMIVGYPNETREHFEDLVDFIETVKFDRLGCFMYSQEDATTAFPLGDPVPVKEKQRRVRELMAAQEKISLEKNTTLVGTKQRVLIDRIENGTAWGRTIWDAPEVDNEVVLDSAVAGFNLAELKTGSFYTAEITDAEAFDLFGTVLALDE
ncbi:MAG: 30S ribosomal protein S12 methylthiotransferase RimO [Bacteroidetes bacterium]|nr:30S ribosomal protein S12 methylthiotransferase RimO [Bacteroidota bacterium]MCH8524120.1 30S ribosomal protein S12 methylthiotransferase RimO [Balneolales bacterium]